MFHSGKINGKWYWREVAQASLAESRKLFEAYANEGRCYVAEQTIDRPEIGEDINKKRLPAKELAVDFCFRLFIKLRSFRYAHSEIARNSRNKNKFCSFSISLRISLAEIYRASNAYKQYSFASILKRITLRIRLLLHFYLAFRSEECFGQRLIL